MSDSGMAITTIAAQPTQYKQSPLSKSKQQAHEPKPHSHFIKKGFDMRSHILDGCCAGINALARIRLTTYTNTYRKHLFS